MVTGYIGYYWLLVLILGVFLFLIKLPQIALIYLILALLVGVFADFFEKTGREYSSFYYTTRSKNKMKAVSRIESLQRIESKAPKTIAKRAKLPQQVNFLDETHQAMRHAISLPHHYWHCMHAWCLSVAHPS